MSAQPSTLIRSSKTSSIMDNQLIDHAHNELKTLSFPTTKHEAWKYTRLTKIASKQFQIQEKSLFNLELEKLYVLNDAYRIVFVNGFYQADLSEIDEKAGIEVHSVKSEKINTTISSEHDVFNLLNTVYATDGFSIVLAENKVLSKPIEITHLVSGEHNFAGTRNTIEIKKNSTCSILLNYLSLDAIETFSNVVTEITLHDNAQLTLDKLQQEENSCYHVSNEYIHQLSGSTLSLNTATLGGALVRNTIHVEVSGKLCTTNLNGVYITRNKQHVDNHTVIDHKEPHCNSNELYKGVMNDSSTAVFNGKVYVRKDAQKTNAFQQNGNVLLSESASVNSKPELEIYADDVKCSHGSTTGQLDDDAIYYLRARGISEESAKHLVTHAFLSDAIENFHFEEVKQLISDTPF